MAKKEMKAKTKAKKGLKKSFYEVKAPMTSTVISLYSTSPESLNGRTVRLDLTKNLRGKSLELKLRIKLIDGELVEEPETVELVGSYVRKVMRSGTDYCEDSFKTNCRDFEVQIKPLLITRKRVSRTVLNVLRKTAREFLEGYVKTRTAQEIFSEIVSNKIQKQLSLKLKKVYPLALCEIRAFNIISKLAEEKKEKANDNSA
jgi:ribosomal protein S3AE